MRIKITSDLELVHYLQVKRDAVRLQERDWLVLAVTNTGWT